MLCQALISSKITGHIKIFSKGYLSMVQTMDDLFIYYGPFIITDFNFDHRKAQSLFRQSQEL